MHGIGSYHLQQRTFSCTMLFESQFFERMKTFYNLTICLCNNIWHVYHSVIVLPVFFCCVFGRLFCVRLNSEFWVFAIKSIGKTYEKPLLQLFSSLHPNKFLTLSYFSTELLVWHTIIYFNNNAKNNSSMMRTHERKNKRSTQTVTMYSNKFTLNVSILMSTIRAIEPLFFYSGVVFSRLHSTTESEKDHGMCVYINV